MLVRPIFQQTQFHYTTLTIFCQECLCFLNTLKHCLYIIDQRGKRCYNSTSFVHSNQRRWYGWRHHSTWDARAAVAWPIVAMVCAITVLPTWEPPAIAHSATADRPAPIAMVPAELPISSVPRRPVPIAMVPARLNRLPPLGPFARL